MENRKRCPAAMAGGMDSCTKPWLWGNQAGMSKEAGRNRNGGGDCGSATGEEQSAYIGREGQKQKMEEVSIEYRKMRNGYEKG